MDSRQKLALLDSLKPSAKARKVLGACVDRLTPCVWLVPATQQKDSVGCVGGGPLLAPGQEWPTHEDAPLPFLFRLRLVALPGWLGLPTEGVLQAFGGFSKFQLSLAPEADGKCTEAPVPEVPYFGFEVETGEFYEREMLRASPGLCWAEHVEEEQESEANELLEGLKPEEAYIRIGGPAAAWVDVEGQRESAYFELHGHSWLYEKPRPETLDAEIERLRSTKPVEPFDPGPVPAVVSAELLGRAEKAARVNAILKRVNRKPGDYAAAAGKIGRLAKATQRETKFTGSQVQDWIDLAIQLGAWEDGLLDLPGEVRTTLEDDPELGFAPLRTALQILRARQTALLKPAGLTQSLAESVAALPGAPLRVQLEQLGALDRDRSAQPESVQNAWVATRDLLVKLHQQLTSGEIAWALREIYRIGFNFAGAQKYKAGPTLEQLLARQKVLRWWHQDIPGHEQAMNRLEPLFTVYSAGEFLWGDCGHLIYWLDRNDFQNGRLDRAVGLIGST